jgi:hypothetical protein
LTKPTGALTNEFAAAGLLVTGGERTLPQQVKLILVETSFEAEQKSIVAMTRHIDRFLIDQHLDRRAAMTLSPEQS